MRHLAIFVVSAALLMSAVAQNQNSAADKAANLRTQLADVEAKQQALQTRLQDLDEQLKPENIASGLAGVGSTHPEDLREQRRRQLEIERNGVQAQINLLATSHARLETAIANADAEAYRQSAAPTTVVPASPGGPSVDQINDTATPTRRPRHRKKKARKSKRTRHTETVSKSVISEQP